MIATSGMTRLIGTSKNAALLYVAIALAVLGWIGGAVPWWLGLLALGFACSVRKATLQVRRYDAWAAEWRAMSGYSAPANAAAKPAKRPASRGRLATQTVVFGFMAWVFWNMTAAGQTPSGVQVILWLVTSGGFIWSAGKLIGSARLTGSMAKATPKAGVTTKAAPTQADVVEWTVPPASSSPSRLDVIRRLPEYCARLLEVSAR